MLGIFRCVLQRQSSTIPSCNAISSFRPAAILGCNLPIVELHGHLHVAASLSGSISYAIRPIEERDRHHRVLAKHQQIKEQEHTPLCSSVQVDSTHHLTSRTGAEYYPQSHASQQQRFYWSNRRVHNYSTADVVKKLRIPSKQVPNPDEACRLAHMHEWQVIAIFHEGLSYWMDTDQGNRSSHGPSNHQ